MPTGEGFIDSMWFRDDLESFLQMKFRIHAGNLDHRLEEDYAEGIRRCIIHNEQQEQQTRQALRDMGRWALPPGLDDLHEQLLHMHDAHIDPDDGHGIMTWYLNHRTAWRCNIGRPVTLPAQVTEWMNAILSHWRDEYDDTMPVIFHLVQPRPYDLEAGIVAHLIIVQPELFDVAALLLSVYDDAYSDRRVTRFAVLHEPRISREGLLQHADNEAWCERSFTHCTAWYGWDELRPQELIDFASGAGFTISIDRSMAVQPAQASWNVPAQQDSGDHLTLLQTDVSFRNENEVVEDPLCEEDQKVPGPYDHDQPCNAESCDAPENGHLDAIADDRHHVPRPLPIEHMPNWIQSLWPAFQAFTTVTNPVSQPNCVVQTWYLNHRTQVRCEQGRPMRLSNNFENWHQEAKLLWSDLIEQAHPCMFGIVKPDPLPVGPIPFVAHLIISQHRDDEVLLADRSVEIVSTTIFEHEVHPRMQQMAIIMPAWSLADDIFYVLRILNTCRQRRAAGVACFIQHGPNIMELGLRDLLHPGDSIVVHVPPMPSASSGLQLLQSKAKLLNKSSQGNAVAASPQLRDPPVQVQLDDALPKPVWTKVDFSRVCYLRTCLQEPRFPNGTCQTDGVPWKECSQKLLDALWPWQGQKPQTLHFYTDGSADNSNDHAASAVILLIETTTGWCFGGYHTFQPICSNTAQSAEHAAILGAVLWSIDIVHQSQCQPNIVIHFDCLAAGIAASGRWNSPAAGTATITRALVMWLEVLTPQVEWSHTPAHTNNPGNEAVDTLSRQAWQKHVFTCELRTLWNICTFDEQHPWVCEWLWYLEKAFVQPSQTPLIFDQMVWFNVRAPFDHSPKPELQAFSQRHPTVPIQSDVSIRIKVATANVLTLFPGDSGFGRFISARAESLLCQFAEAGIHFIGMQETRLRQGGHHQANGFHILSAAATEQGHSGVSLCVSQTIHFDGQMYHVGCHDLHIAASSPRHIIVKLQSQDIQLLLIVAHVPFDDKHEIAQAFWNTVSDDIPAQCHGWTTVALVDANARVGSLTTKCIGPHQADEQNENGLALHKWLQTNDMYLPQTFAGCHQGDAHTWTHAQGTVARIDFIALSSDIDATHVTTYVDETLDIQVTRADHNCVVAECWINGKLPTRKCRRTVRDDRPQPASYITWRTNVHDHAALLQQQIRQVHQDKKPVWKRKKHLSDATWQLIQTKKWHFRQAQFAERTWRIGMLRTIFASWRDVNVRVDDMRQWQQECLSSSAWHRLQLHNITQQVKHACKQDDAAFYESLAQKTAQCIHDSPHGVWNAVRPLLPKTRKKRTASLKCGGPSVDARCSYYAQLEAGAFQTFEQALESCHQHQMGMIDDAPLQATLANIPSRLRLEQLCNNVRTGRACGLDGISPEVWKHKNVEVAESLCALMMKIWLTSAEPFQFKGGRLHSIAKRHGSTNVEDLRGIMILDGIGKLFHALLRQKFLETASQWRQPMQLGGYPRQQTLFGTHYIRSLMKVCSATTMSCSVLFLDLKSAFHTLLREHLMGHQHALPADLSRVLQQSGFDVGTLEDEIENHSQWFQTDVPTDVQRAMQDAHIATWFMIEGEEQICTTTRGSRPGSPLADLAFNAFISHLIWEVQSRLNDLPAMRTAHTKLQTTTPILGWVDDIAVPLVTTRPHEMSLLIADATSIVFQACQRRGLTLNFRPGKTEVICSLKGVGSSELKRSLFVDNLGHLPLQDPPVNLRLVGSYEHLGTRCSQSGSITHEIHTRIGKAVSAHRTIRKPILCNRRIAATARIRLLEALVMPVLMHGSGNWPILNRRTFVKVQGVIVSWIRIITNDGHWQDQQTNDTDLLAKWNILDLKGRLNKCRLLYGFQMLRNAPQPLIEFVTAADSFDQGEWLGAIREAITWVSQLDDTLARGTQSSMTAEQILNWFQQHRHHGPARVRRCAIRHVHLENQMYQVRMLHKDLRDIAQTNGMIFESLPTPPLEIVGEHPCPDCHSVFRHPQHLAAHRWRKHGSFSDERRFCFDAVCRACQTCFWSTQRLQQHLKASRRFPDGCYCQLTWWCGPLTQLHHVDRPESLRMVHRLPACPI